MFQRPRDHEEHEVTARLCARDVFTQENAERWQTEYALHMQAAGFDLGRGVHGSKSKHMDPAVYNAIKAEEAKLEAEKDELKMQKEVLKDEVDTLQSEKDALTIEIETLNREKKQTETAVKSLQTMCRNLTIQKTLLTTERTELQSQLSEGKITLDEYNRKKADLEKQISNCDVKLSDKQQKLEQKMKELQDIKDKVNFYDVAYVRFDVPEIKVNLQRLQSVHLALGILTTGRRLRTRISENNSIMLSIHSARLSWMRQRIAYSENVSFG